MAEWGWLMAAVSIRNLDDDVKERLRMRGFLVPESDPMDPDGPDEDGDEPAPEEECKAEFKPLVQLEEVEVTSGEEDEEALFD